jgi:hypothetical protein
MQVPSGNILKTRQDEIQFVKYLAHVMYTEPTIQSCYRHIRNSCLSNEIHIHESGKRLSPGFTENILPQFTKFAADAIRMHYMCGFVAYYTEKRNDVCTPHTLPLGSFTWRVERRSGNGGVWPFALKIRGIDCNFEEARVHIFTRDVCSTNVMYSPMEGIIRLLTNYNSIQESITSNINNNEKVNVLVSEKIDIKDQTLNGIQMLDDARQYMIKGNTPLQQYDLGVRLTGVRQDTVNLARESALQQTNEAQSKVQLTSIPPNSQVTTVAMNAPQMDVLKESYRQYTLACHEYFGVDVSPADADTKTQAVNTIRPSSNVQCMCEMLEELTQQAYAFCFKVPPQQVHVKFSRPKLDVQSADVKTLFECGIFTPQELKKRFS